MYHIAIIEGKYFYILPVEHNPTIVHTYYIDVGIWKRVKKFCLNIRCSLHKVYISTLIEHILVIFAKLIFDFNLVERWDGYILNFSTHYILIALGIISLSLPILWNWHERSALQSVSVRRKTGYNVSGLLFSALFSFSPIFKWAPLLYEHERERERDLFLRWYSVHPSLHWCTQKFIPH